jgi:hypothetical protein
MLIVFCLRSDEIGEENGASTHNVFHHSTIFLGQKVDFTRDVKVLYGFSDISRYL